MLLFIYVCIVYVYILVYIYIGMCVWVTYVCSVSRVVVSKGWGMYIMCEGGMF